VAIAMSAVPGLGCIDVGNIKVRPEQDGQMSADEGSRTVEAVICVHDSDCTTGFCIEGFCCDKKCFGSCLTCALPTALGICTLVPAGQAHLNDCEPQFASTCQSDGVCDGKGGCQLWPEGTECGVATCPGVATRLIAACDGAGTCAPLPDAGLDCGVAVDGAARD
jgi:hypothetical protein